MSTFLPRKKFIEIDLTGNVLNLLVLHEHSVDISWKKKSLNIYRFKIYIVMVMPQANTPKEVSVQEEKTMFAQIQGIL